MGINAGFEDIYKNKRARYEGKLGGDDLYFDSAHPGSEVSENKGDLIENNMCRMILTKCKKKGCPLHIRASIDGNIGKFSVKAYVPVHKYCTRTRNKLCNPLWISKFYKDKIMSEPIIKLNQIQSLIRKNYGLYVSKTTCRRAKLKIMKDHMGNFIKEFSRLYDYVKELKSTYPETTVVCVYGFLCLSWSIEKWLKESCRWIIDFDGAFLKGVCKGKILSCISKDENNQMYLVAWAVIKKECEDTWSWFIRCIKHNLELDDGEGLTVMPDMQKV
ncbi:unnamed protein product [Withania somnifera]